MSIKSNIRGRQYIVRYGKTVIEICSDDKEIIVTNEADG